MHPTVRYSWVRRNIQFLVQTCPMNAIICFRVHIRLSQIRLKERSIRIEMMILKLAKILYSSLSQRVRVSRGDRSTRNIQSRSTVSYSVQCVNERFVGWPRMYEIEIANWNFGILSQVFDFFSLSLSHTWIREFIDSQK